MTRQMLRRLSVIALTAVTITGCGRDKPDADDKPKQAGAAKAPTRTASGDPIVRLEPAAQTRIGILTQTAKSQSIQRELVAFGRLEEDPARVFVLRAPVAGTLRERSGRSWPRLGEVVPDEASAGVIEPRLAPADRISLTNQLAAARADLTASTSSAAAAKAAYERTRVLNADNKNVSDRALEEAATRVASEAAKLKTAQDTVSLLDASLRSTGPSSTAPLVVERGGEVIEVMAQPGESVEPGTPILRVAKFDRLLARVDMPVGEHIPPEVSTARIFAVGHEDRPLTAERIGLAASSQSTAQGESVLFRLMATGLGLRPGIAVTARIPVSGPERTGILVPATAIVRLAGKAYVFTQTSPNEFVRKEVTLDQPIDGGFAVARNVAPGDRLVVQGAELLLSEEFKAQLAGEADKS